MELLNTASALADTADDADLPVEDWHPAHCGALDLVIRTDGVWVHEGTPIGRPKLVRLFSRILRRDPGGYVLVTPAEKLDIRVDDVPFLVVDVDRKDDGFITVRTNVGDTAVIGPDHRLEMRSYDGAEAVAYVRIRGDLWARFGRSAWFRLVDMADIDADVATVQSGPHVYSLTEQS